MIFIIFLTVIVKIHSFYLQQLSTYSQSSMNPVLANGNIANFTIAERKQRLL